MKRYIKSSKASNRDRLRKWGFTDDEIDQLGDEKIRQMLHEADKPLLSPEVEKQIYSEFDPATAAEICARIECGDTVDGAIQSVLFRE